jgi:hypothetical protein
MSQGTLARSNANKAHAFTEHLKKWTPRGKEALIQFLEAPYQLKPPINWIKRAEVREVSSLNLKKLSGYDLITGKILKILPNVGVKYLTQLFSYCSKGTSCAMEIPTDYPHLEARETS